LNLRSLLLRAALVAALFGFAFAVATLTPRAGPESSTVTRTASPILLPLVALPLVQALLTP
jgi:hypothetical protein